MTRERAEQVARAQQTVYEDARYTDVIFVAVRDARFVGGWAVQASYRYGPAAPAPVPQVAE